MIGPVLYQFHFLHRFWEYDGRRLLRSGSIQLLNGLTGLPRRFSNVNAVFTLQGDQMTYFIKGKRYWRYSEPTGSRYTGRIRGDWRLVKNIDAATTWINKKVYVFQGEYYYRLKSIKNGNIFVDRRRYPQRIAKRWMRCPKQAKDRMSIGRLDSEP